MALAGRHQDRERAALAVAGKVDPWSLVRLGIVRGRDRPVRPAGAAPLSPRGGGVLVSADDGRVDLDQPVDVAGRVGVDLDLLQGL